MPQQELIKYVDPKMYHCPECRKSINLRKARQLAKENDRGECYHCGQYFAIQGQVQLLLSVFLVLGLSIASLYLFDLNRVIVFFIALAATSYLAKVLIKLERIPKG